MLLSIITITYNNLQGLQQTLQSISRQTFADYELIVIDGASSDGTADWLSTTPLKQHLPNLTIVSEPDNGVYDAQNKGITLAKGDYCFFLNAGDRFTADTVLATMLHEPAADIIYGNEIVVDSQGERVGICRGPKHPSWIDVYNSFLKHQATFIARRLFCQYGNYDAGLRIVADWEWFFRVVAFHSCSLSYIDCDVSFFENTGISYHNPDLCRQERTVVLHRYLTAEQQQTCRFWACYPRIVRLRQVRTLSQLMSLYRPHTSFVRYLLRLTNGALRYIPYCQ